MPQPIWLRNPLDPQPDELQAILHERKRALECVASWGTLEPYVPACDRHGWRATWKPVERDLDGNLLVEIRVTAPVLDTPYVRRYRLIHRERLISRLRQELRET
jgi:hypothetical protein